MFGGRFELSYQKLFWLLRHRVTLAYSLLVVLVLFALDSPQYLTVMSPLVSLIIWILSGAIFFATRMAVHLPLAFFAFRRPNSVIYLPIVTVFEALITICLVEEMVHYATRGTFNPKILEYAPSYLFMFLVVDFFFMRSVMPQILGKAVVLKAMRPDVDQPKGTLAQHDTISVGERRLRSDSILWLHSQEHYVTLTLRSSVLVVRCKLSDLANQFESGQGVQPHRSWWVSRHAMPVLSGKASNLQIVLSDGTVVPVARSRAKETQDWFDRYCDW